MSVLTGCRTPAMENVKQRDFVYADSLQPADTIKKAPVLDSIALAEQPTADNLLPIEDTVFAISPVLSDSLVEADSLVLSDSLTVSDSLYSRQPDSLTYKTDLPDMPLNDSIKRQDSLVKAARKKGTVLDYKLERSAEDSIIQNMKNRKVYLYGNAVVIYGDIKLEAAFIEVNFDRNEVFAKGMPDSTGKIRGTPVFTESGQTFEAKTMTYNFDTKKGIINTVFTEDGQGFIHGNLVKKMDNDNINIRSGSYTTCNNKEHPHFEFKFRKSKVIPDNKIVTGPAYLAIEGVPTPIAVPFGLFPNNSGQRSGVVIPTYGESRNRGFYFENGGYYWAINDYMDLNILGDIYTRGSWALKPTLRYTKRYKFSGNLNTSYAINITGEEGAADYSQSRDFRIRWTHRQDAKARPSGRFSADVFIVSSNFNTFNPVTTENYLSNEFKSSIAYQTNWDNKYFLTLNASHRQNTKTKMVEVTLPEMTFSVNRLYPLKKENRTGQSKWYEELNINYNLNARNSLSLPDSMLFKPDAVSKMQNGIQHNLPINLPLKVLKYFTLTNSMKITDRMYFDSKRRSWSNDTLFENNDTIVGYVKTDTIQGFNNVIDFNFSTSLSTKVYGMVNFRKGPIRAIRHVLTPNVGFTYTPEFGDPYWGYYDSYVDGEGDEQFYSKFDGSIYGSPPKDKSGRISFGLSNNLEIKVPSKKDTISGMRKVILIENLSISGSYDLARDSLKLSYITMSGRTKLFKNLNVQYSSSWDPYVLDSAGNQINRFEWDENKRLLRKDNSTWSFGLNWNLSQQDFAKDKDSKKTAEDEDALLESRFGSEQEIAEINANPDDYVDWSVPWSLGINYNLRYSNNISYRDFTRNDERKIVQTLGVSGEVNVTPKWKFTFRTGWDFEANDLSYTSINIYRDLHCWEMRFSWIPLGARQSWNFSINVKASVLQDLKLNKKKDFRDI
ncbi:MAG: putative LPS assembly protein LptD [Bacteroidetes bacterium]|jgi:lipopolysaccharide assembly outer membrane protein LptD (OstA)|nr:putative LPS assembly protein LptD [Bacteroidota bacterium]